MNFDFGEVLARAGQITWKYKSLWLAGIVVGLIGILPSLLTLPFSSSFFSFTDPSQVNRQLPSIFLLNALTLVVVLLSIPIYVVAMTIPSLGTLQLERGSETLNFRELIKGTFPYFWRILGVLALVWLGMFVVMFAFMACGMLLSVVTFGLGALCIFPLFIPLAIVTFAMMEQGMAAVLVDNLGVSGALQHAWELIKQNPWVIALMSILIYLIVMVASMMISVPMMIPMFGFMNNITSMTGPEPDFQAFETMFRNMTWWMLALSPFFAIFQGLFLTFTQSAWTLTYLRLTQNPQLQPLPQEATV